MIVYFTCNLSSLKQLVFSFSDIFFQKKVFALVSKLFKAINQDLSQHEQLTVISGLQLAVLLM